MGRDWVSGEGFFEANLRWVHPICLCGCNRIRVAPPLYCRKDAVIGVGMHVMGVGVSGKKQRPSRSRTTGFVSFCRTLGGLTATGESLLLKTSSACELESGVKAGLVLKMTTRLDKVVLVDMDNTLVDFDLEFGKRWVQARPQDGLELIKSRKHFELEQNFSPDLKPLAIQIMSQSGFFIAFEPQKYAVQAVKEMEAAGLHVMLCTAPLPFQYESCVAEKYAWVRKWLGEEWLSRIVITRDKTVVKGKVLIDDKPRVKGACEEPEWVHVLFDQPYNREVMDRPRMMDWTQWRSVVGEFVPILE